MYKGYHQGHKLGTSLLLASNWLVHKVFKLHCISPKMMTYQFKWPNWYLYDSS